MNKKFEEKHGIRRAKQIDGINTSHIKITEGKIQNSKLILYSPDTGFQRYVIEVTPTGFALRLNEYPCSMRGTFQKMALVAGVDLSALENLTWSPNHIDLGFI